LKNWLPTETTVGCSTKFYTRIPCPKSNSDLGHFNPMSDALLQRPRDGQSKKFNPADDKTWFCSAPLGTTTLDSVMSKRAGIEPHLANHTLRATSVTLLSDHNYGTRHNKSTTGLKSDQSYNERPSMKQQQKMSLVVSYFMHCKCILQNFVNQLSWTGNYKTKQVLQHQMR